MWLHHLPQGQVRSWPRPDSVPLWSVCWSLCRVECKSAACTAGSCNKTCLKRNAKQTEKRNLGRNKKKKELKDLLWRIQCRISGRILSGKNDSSGLICINVYSNRYCLCKESRFTEATRAEELPEAAWERKISSGGVTWSWKKGYSIYA